MCSQHSGGESTRLARDATVPHALLPEGKQASHEDKVASHATSHVYQYHSSAAGALPPLDVSKDHQTCPHTGHANHLTIHSSISISSHNNSHSKSNSAVDALVTVLLVTVWYSCSSGLILVSAPHAIP